MKTSFSKLNSSFNPAYARPYHVYIKNSILLSGKIMSAKVIKDVEGTHVIQSVLDL